MPFCIIFHFNFPQIIINIFLIFQKLLTGFDDLRDVQELCMKVDTRDTSLGNFGMHLPNLKRLKLSNSIITQTR